MDQRPDKEFRICRFVEPYDGGGGHINNKKNESLKNTIDEIVPNFKSSTMSLSLVEQQEKLKKLVEFERKNEKMSRIYAHDENEELRERIRTEAEQNEIDKMRKLYGF